MNAMSKETRTPLARIMVIDQRLRDKSWPSAITLAHDLEVDVRTIHRDIAFMRYQLRAPINYVREHNGFHYSSPNFQLPYHQATEGELLAILLGANLLKQYVGTPFERDLTNAFQKLTTALPEQVTISLESLRQNMSVRVNAKARIAPTIYQAALVALKNHHRMEITYWTASSNRESVRQVDPYHLTMINDDCFLVAYCHTRRQVLMFSLHRIRSCEVCKERFTIPSNFNLQEYLGKSFRSVRGEDAVEVVLHFSSEIAPRIAERTWHSSQVTKPLEDGRLELHLEVSGLVEVMRWILSWGKDCRVVKPRELAALVAKEHRLALE